MEDKTTFELKGGHGTYTVYPRINKDLAEEVFKQTGLWLRFPEGEKEIRFNAGKGYFGGMYLAKCDNRFLGIKIITGKDKVEQSREEGDIQTKLNGLKHLMPLVDSFKATLENAPALCHVMPLAGFGNIKILSEILHQKNVSKELLLAIAYHVARGLFLGLQQMHEHRIYHFDIKPENIVMNGEAKVFIIDFACAQTSSNGYFDQDYNGDYDYFSPERRQLRNRDASYFTGEAADAWAAGMTLLYFLEGALNEDILENPKKHLKKLRQESRWPTKWLDLLEGFFVFNSYDPAEQSKRLTMSQALEKLTALKPDDLEQQLQQLPEIVQDFKQGDTNIEHPLIRKINMRAKTIPVLSADRLQALSRRYEIFLKETYISQGSIPQLFGKDLSLEEGQYINLSMIQTVEHKKEQEEKKEGKQEEQKTFQDQRLGSFEDLYGEKLNIRVDQLFDKSAKQSEQPDKTKHRFALVQGRAGIGKTTFSRYVSYHWAKQTLWKGEYAFLFRITLRELLSESIFTVKKRYSIAELIYYSLFPNENREEFLAFWNQQITQLPEKQILILLDGYDEISQITGNPNHPLYQALHELIHASGFQVILTSRPYGLGDLPQDRQNLEIMGFNNDNIQTYVNRYFQQICPQPSEAKFRAEKLLNFLKQNPSVWSSAHIPINLNLLCGIQEKLNPEEHLTFSELYIKLEETLLQRALESEQKLIGTQEERKEQMLRAYSQERLFLRNLAFNALQEESLIIKPPLIKKTLEQITRFAPKLSDVEAKEAFFTRVQRIGLLKPVTSVNVNSNERDKPHEYLHLTFQEYYAATYLAECLKNPAAKTQAIAMRFIRQEKFNPRYQIVFWFLAGLLKEDLRALQTYFNLLQDEATRDLIGDYQMALLSRCYEEALTDKTETLLSPIFNRLQAYFTRWWQLAVRDREQARIEPDAFLFIQLLSLSPRFNQHLMKAVSDIMTQSLQHINGDIRIRATAAVTLTSLSQGQVPPQMIAALVQTLEDWIDFVRMNAARALGELSQTPSEVITALIQALGDEDELVWSNADKALRKLGRGSHEVIAALIQILWKKDDYSYVRQRATQVLVELGEESSEVTTALIQALEDNKSNVRLNAVQALAMTTQPTPKKIAALIQVMSDDHLEVRTCAIRALGKLRQPTPEVIAALIQALRDEDEIPLVRQTVIQALIEIGQPTPEIIAALAQAIQNSKFGTCKEAITALGEFGQVTPEVITALIQALGDEAPWIRAEAAQTLVKLDQVTPGVITTLIQTFGDEKFRIEAAEILIKLAQTTPEVITALIQALGDENPWIRAKVAQTLVKLDQVTTKVIITLNQSLEDEHSWVRTLSAQALVKLGHATPKVIVALIQSLEDNDVDDRTDATEALVKLSQVTPEVIYALIQTLRDKNSLLRASVAEVLGKLEQRPPEVIATLIQVLGDKDDCFSRFRENAAEALGKLGQGLPEVIDALTQVLGDKNPRVSAYAAQALVRLGQVTPKVIAVLIRALGKSDYYWAYKLAVESLVKLAQETPELIDALIQALWDKNDLYGEVRKEAIKMLETLDQRAPKVIAALIQVLGDKENSACRWLAAKALNKLIMPSLIEQTLLTDRQVSNDCLLIIGFVSQCVQNQTSVRIGYDAKTSGYRLHYVLNKKMQAIPLNPQQAQAYLHLIPLAFEMLLGEKAFDFAAFKTAFQQQPAVDQDPLLQALKKQPLFEEGSSEEKEEEEKPQAPQTEQRFRQSTPFSTLLGNLSQAERFKRSTGARKESPEAWFQPAPPSPTPPNNLSSVLRAILTVGQLNVVQEGKLVKIGLLANNNSTATEPLLTDLYERLEALPEWQTLGVDVGNCDIQGEFLTIPLLNPIKAGKLKRLIETAYAQANTTQPRSGSIPEQMWS